MEFIRWQEGGQHILYRADLQLPPTGTTTAFDPTLFEPARLKADHKIYGSARGRGTSYFLQEQDQRWILRHYRRGGLVGKFCRDWYAWQTFANTRPVRELQLLALLEQLKLPAPTPVAGRVIYQGLGYRADIITGVIDNSRSLVQTLREPPGPELWGKIGATIKRFHRHNIYHADLNAHNILINDQQEIFLIDFDKGRQRNAAGDHPWQQQNLRRLQRSLMKEKSGNRIGHFGETEWQKLMKGYREGNTGNHKTGG